MALQRLFRRRRAGFADERGDAVRAAGARRRRDRRCGRRRREAFADASRERVVGRQELRRVVVEFTQRGKRFVAAAARVEQVDVPQLQQRALTPR